MVFNVALMRLSLDMSFEIALAASILPHRVHDGISFPNTIERKQLVAIASYEERWFWSSQGCYVRIVEKEAKTEEGTEKVPIFKD